jgi:hypothetical protein
MFPTRVEVGEGGEGAHGRLYGHEEQDGSKESWLPASGVRVWSGADFYVEKILSVVVNRGRRGGGDTHDVPARRPM